MTHARRPPTTALTAVLTAGLTATLVTGCGTGQPTSAQSTSPPVSATPTSPWAAGADLTTIDRSDPAAVSTAFTEALLSYDTTHDDSTLDAAARAGALATEEFAAELTAPERAAGTGWWWQAAEHEASARVRIEVVEDEGRPEDTGDQAYGLWSVRWWMTGTDGWSGTVTDQVVYVTMQTTPDGWAVTQVAVR